MFFYKSSLQNTVFKITSSELAVRSANLFLSLLTYVENFVSVYNFDLLQ